MRPNKIAIPKNLIERITDMFLSLLLNTKKKNWRILIGQGLYKCVKGWKEME